jgi:CHAD domain-containing protein
MAHVEHDEIEAKFAILETTQADILRTAPTLTTAYELHGVQRVHHRDVYMDTPTFGLLRTGCALRIRHSPTGASVTLKSLPLAKVKHIHRRVELEEKLAPDTDPLAVAYWPPTIGAALAERLGAAFELQPLCAIYQTRDKRLVSMRGQAESTPFAELSIDEVSVFGPDQARAMLAGCANLDALTPLAVSWEAEAELLPGGAETDLDALAQKLARRPGLRPLARSKFERALELVHERLSVDGQLIEQIEPAMHMADACRLIWRKHLMAMLLNEAGVRYSDDIAYVHNMRVAIRRMRVALRLFGRYFRGKHLRAVGKALQKTGRLLGAVRDRDVALARLAKHRQASEGKAHDKVIADTWRRERNQAFTELLGWLNSESYAEFIGDFAAFCAEWGKDNKTPGGKESAGLAPVQVRHVIPQMLLKRFGRIRIFELLFEKDRPVTADMLHQLRIECKFLRYNLEFVQHLLGPGGAQLIRSLKHLQSNLGDLNDAAVSRQLLISVEPKGDASSLVEYDAEQSAAIERLRHAVYDNIGQFLGLANRRRLAQAIARI